MQSTLTTQPSAAIQPSLMQPPITRFHFMDSMRSILMILGIFLHSAQVFNPAQNWRIYSSQTTPLAEHLVQIITAFRMPAFFVISGFFCVLTLLKYDPKKFLSVRMKRILIPFIATALTLNILQLYLLDVSGWLQFSTTAIIDQGKWVSHLWFLTNLVVYFLVSAALFAVFNRVPFVKIIGTKVVNILRRIPLTLTIACLPLASVAILASNKFGFPLYSDLFGFLKTYSIMLYLPYFAFGALLAGDRELLKKFSNFSPALSIPLLALAFVTLNYSQSLSFSDGLSRVIAVYFKTLISWLSVSLCFYTFNCFFNQPSRLWSFMSDASYTIYLFHHVIVIALGLLLIKWQLPGVPGLLLLISITLFITVMIHKHLILKVGPLRFLYNGK